MVAFRTFDCPPVPKTATVSLRNDDVLVKWEMPLEKIDPAITDYVIHF